MTRMHCSSRRRGFAKLASVWLLFWLGLGGVFLYKAAPKAEPGTDERAQILACSTPAAQPQPQPHTKRIEDVQAGDRVWAYDPQTGRWEAKPVIKPLTHEYAGDLVTVTVAGHAVQATGNHPFWVEAGKDLEQRPYSQDVPPADQSRPTRGRWVDARHLEAGDVLVLRSGGLAAIEMVTVQQTRQTVYNLKVADLHTYAVGDMGIAVHNKPCFPPGTLVLMGDGSAKAIDKIELGDMVLARDPEAGGPARPAKVSGLIRDFASWMVHLRLLRVADGQVGPINVTRFHPIWTVGRGWVEAKDISAGDVLCDERGGAVRVVAVSTSRAVNRTYNLSVAGVHTFYVTAASGCSILVHNAHIPDFPVGGTINVDPWEVQFSHPDVAPDTVFSHGPLEGQTVQGVADMIAEGGGALPEGLNLNVGVYNNCSTLVTANNRSLLALQLSNVPSVPATIVDDATVQAQLRGRLPIAPEDLPFRAASN